MTLYFYLNEIYELKQEEKSALHNKLVVYISFEKQKITKSSFTVKNSSKKTFTESYKRKFQENVVSQNSSNCFLKCSCHREFWSKYKTVTGLKHQDWTCDTIFYIYFFTLSH